MTWMLCLLYKIITLIEHQKGMSNGHPVYFMMLPWNVSTWFLVLGCALRSVVLFACCVRHRAAERRAKSRAWEVLSAARSRGR